MTYGSKSQGSFFRVGSKTRANGGNTMGPLLFWGWGGWLVGCLLAPDWQREAESDVCVRVCIGKR